MPILDNKIEVEKVKNPVLPEIKTAKTSETPNIMLDLGKDDVKDTDIESFSSWEKCLSN